MPIKSRPSLEYLTFEDAKKVVATLQSNGIPVANLREVLASGQVVSTSDPDYYADGGMYQYIATVWAADQELGYIKANLDGNSSRLGKMLEISTSVFQDKFAALNAVVNLPDIYTAIEGAIKL